LVKKGKGRAVEKINGEEMQIGFETACKVVKNGLAPEGRTASYWFYNVRTEQYGFGVDQMEEIVRLGILTGVIDRRGGWYHHPALPEDKTGEHRLLGKDRLVDHIRDSQPLRALFSKEITEKLRTGDMGAKVAPMSVDPEADIEESSYPNLLDRGVFDG
jgi:hypothetical protein